MISCSKTSATIRRIYKTLGALPPTPPQGHHALDLIFSHKRCLCEDIGALESWDLVMHRGGTAPLEPDTAET